ncbi:hypothetical protein S40285_02143 [Stachybotrys chlorohalonatus IBT 40285]|uniref:Large ribosomal subunit protein mL49 n=1 Tax=Stachybotrys chlorohalonatus (strain IBT 40285) TaxID=1283841 RepID=A0A084QDL8_STAC4|nr:hypothetical protein S40285_02143 [Stachybotrys chlorohalonata IBT 40285]
MSRSLTRALTSSRASLLRPCQTPATTLPRPLFTPTTHTRSLTVPGQTSLKGKGRNYISPELKRPKGREPTPPPAKSPEELAKGPYVVARTPSVALPVYRKWSAGNTKLTTMVQKITGNKQRLKDDLVRDLQLNEEHVRLNPITNHLEIKGDQLSKIQQWLIQKGF